MPMIAATVTPRSLLELTRRSACRTRCRGVLDIVAEHQCPRVLSVLKDRELRWWKGWIGEGAYRHGSQPGPAFDLVCDGRATMRAEAVSCLMTAVSHADRLCNPG